MNDTYESPFNSRYSSDEMKKIFSNDTKFRTWRRLWIALAEAQKELGLNISKEQIEELSASMNEINYEVANKYEKELKHDVMAHIHAYGEQCPTAKPIIHLGATSCYVGDNTDLIIMRDALKLIQKKLVLLMRHMSEFALKYKGLPTLGFTHFQAAQLVTVGKRASLWLHELVMDFGDIEYMLSQFKLLGSRGTTGTSASFMSLFDGDQEKVKKIDEIIASKMGFCEVFPISGQTYTRKFDFRVLSVLSSIAQSAYKFSNDLRLLQHMKEIEEPFEENQVGSSAMPYKRNPMRSERISALARYVITAIQNPAITTSTQWFERTLDDSANKRVVVPECFLAVDAILNLYINISKGLVVYPKVIEKHIAEELPFMASENILMEAVKKGGDRQELHEALRRHSMEAGKAVKVEGKKNDLIDRIIMDPVFMLKQEDIKKVLVPENYTGRAQQQVEDFIRLCVQPILEKYYNGEADDQSFSVELKV